MKNILVTGGTDGIGLAFVQQLKTSRYEKIFILGRDFSKVENLHIPNIVQLPCDITEHDAINHALRRIDQPLDQFVNTIGTFYRNPVDKITPTDVNQHFELNSIANITSHKCCIAKVEPAICRSISLSGYACSRSPGKLCITVCDKGSL